MSIDSRNLQLGQIEFLLKRKSISKNLVERIRKYFLNNPATHRQALQMLHIALLQDPVDAYKDLMNVAAIIDDICKDIYSESENRQLSPLD